MGSQLKQFSWSLDISTTNVGMALWNEEGRLVELKHLQLKVDNSVPEENRYLHKASLFKDHIRKYKEVISTTYGCEVKNIFVEAPLSNPPVNINTTAKLLAFNGIACYILNEVFGVEPFLITVYQSRKLFCPELVHKKVVKGAIKETLSFPKDVDKKLYIWHKVSKLEPNVEWFYKENKATGKKEVKDLSFDLSDAYTVGYAGLKVMGVLK